jgi:SAM-dependent methyltransferase
MSVAHQSLAEWESAEVERSRLQAALSPAVVRTPRHILRRYANPPADTLYPLEYLYHLLGDLRAQTVLDYGCGDGADSTLLAAAGGRVHALDLSPELLQRAAMRLRADGFADRVRFVCGSAHDVPLHDESVDVVVGHAILHHLDIEASSREVHRVLRAGGRAIFFEPIRDSRVLRVLRPLIPYRQPDVSPFERPLLHAEIASFSRRFHPGRRREFLLPFVAALRLLHAPQALQARAEALDGRLLSTYPRLRYYATITVFELHKPQRAAS